jgi:hypothetical protein
MEEDIHNILKKEKLDTRVFERLEEAVSDAQDRIDLEKASDKELRYALEIVESFLRRKKRVCYGGTAMNVQLPERMKFYSEKDLPDYDFFTPEIDSDVDEIVKDLRRAGFEDVAHRVGMHDGTKKILVNYVPVADISEMERDIYDIVLERSVVIKGIHYTDPDILRMMMYLELSRPKGEVSRWTKVYERLMLINEAFPLKICREEQRQAKKIPQTLRDELHKFVLEKNRILAGARLERIYDKSLDSKKDIKWESTPGGAVIFFSPDPREDALAIREILGFKGIVIEYFKEKGDLIPPRLVVKLYNRPIALIIQETACHSYYTIKSTGGEDVRIASMDTLITLYLCLAIFTNDEKDYLGFSLLCTVARYIQVSKRIRRAPKVKQFEPFALDCQGYQKGYSTLLREKVERIAKEKAAAKLRRLLKKEIHGTAKQKNKKIRTKTLRKRDS